MPLTIKDGDATNIRRLRGDPKMDVLLHGCNDIGAWGAGFVLALSARWPEPERVYRDLANKVKKEEYPFLRLGDIQRVRAADGINVVNMITQHLTGADELGNPPFRPEAFRKALIEVRSLWWPGDCRIHMPWIGCGLAGGTRAVTLQIVKEELLSRGYHVTIYNYTGKG